MYNQILITNINTNTWQLVRRINIAILELSKRLLFDSLHASWIFAHFVKHNWM